MSTDTSSTALATLHEALHDWFFAPQQDGTPRHLTAQDGRSFGYALRIVSGGAELGRTPVVFQNGRQFVARRHLDMWAHVYGRISRADYNKACNAYDESLRVAANA